MTIDAEVELGRRARTVRRDDIADVLEKEGKAKTIVEKAGFLSQYWDDIKTSFALIRDWFNGSYDKVPTRMIVSLAGALIYLVSPLDLIPDWVPMAGFVDDAAMLAFVFQLSKVDLNAYRRWKGRQSGENDGEVAEEA
jgi:uncharacterized membrane protein YkvA (DUF1232 family)